jgi:hypothetical protein
MKTKPKKLRVNPERLRSLTTTDLDGAVGGVIATYTTCVGIRYTMYCPSQNTRCINQN